MSKPILRALGLLTLAALAPPAVVMTWDAAELPLPREAFLVVMVLPLLICSWMLGRGSRSLPAVWLGTVYVIALCMVAMACVDMLTNGLDNDFTPAGLTSFYLMASGIPLALILGLIGTGAWRTSVGRRPEPGVCASCRYDLSGLPEGAACPECGATGIRVTAGSDHGH